MNFTIEELNYLYNCLEATHDLTNDLEDMAEMEQSRRNAELYNVLHEKMLKKIMED